MHSLDSFRAIIGLWPSLEALAGDTGAPITAVRKWSQRDRIPADWWVSVLATERARSVELSADLLAALAARESAEARA